MLGEQGAEGAWVKHLSVFIINTAIKYFGIYYPKIVLKIDGKLFPFYQMSLPVLVTLVC